MWGAYGTQRVKKPCSDTPLLMQHQEFYKPVVTKRAHDQPANNNDRIHRVEKAFLDFSRSLVIYALQADRYRSI